MPSHLLFNLHKLCGRRVFHDDNSALESLLNQRGSYVRWKRENRGLLAALARWSQIPCGTRIDVLA